MLSHTLRPSAAPALAVTAPDGQSLVGYLPLVGLVVGELLPRTSGPQRRAALAVVGIAALGRAAEDREGTRGGSFAARVRTAVRAAVVRAAVSGSSGDTDVRGRLGALLGLDPADVDEQCVAAVLGVPRAELAAGLVEPHEALMKVLTDPQPEVQPDPIG